MSAVLKHFDVVGAQPTVRGASLLDVCVALQEAGLDVCGYRAGIESLRALGALAVVPLTDRDGGTTLVLCRGYDGGKFAIERPGRGVRCYLAPDFARRWPSRMLLRVEAIGVHRPDRYRCFDVSAIPVGHARALVRSHRNGTTRIVDVANANRLLALERFRTLDAHRTWVAGGFPTSPSSDSAIRAEIEAWIEAGYMTSYADLGAEVQRLAHAVRRSDDVGRISSIAVPTCGRNAALERAVRSYLDNVMCHGRSPRIVVASTNSTAGTVELGSRLDELRDEYDVDILHVDDAWKHRMADSLADDTGCPRDVVRFALFGHDRWPSNYGANRNALLLATTGELCLHVDDDTMLPLRTAPAESGLVLSSAFDPNAYWFGEYDGGDLVNHGDVDVLGLFEDTLGCHPARILQTFGTDEIAVEALEPPLLHSLCQPNAAVAITFLGHVGDTGTASNAWRLFVNRESQRRLAGADYSNRISSRYGARAVTRRTLSDGMFCTGMNIGLDNRRLLPPFMPVGRNEDGVFSAVLAAGFPMCLRGFREGYVVQHVPVRERPVYPYPIRFEGFKANDLVAVLVNQLSAARSRGLRQGMAWLGRSLKELSELDPLQLVEVLRTTVYHAVGASAAHVESTLRELGDGIPELSEDIGTYLETVETFVLNDECDVPIDVPGRLPERRAAFRSQIALYGELLINWPDIVRSAESIHIDQTGDV